MTGFRQASRRFLDAKNYPRGFRKSGDFSIAESDILSQLGVTLSTLTAGDVTPETVEEMQFVSVVKGQAPAQSKIEKTWLKYQKLTMSPRKFYTLYSSSKSADESDDLVEEDELDYEVD